MAAAIQYAVGLEKRIAEANFALALIQQSVNEIVDGKARGHD
jgi:hypothetical protein